MHSNSIEQRATVRHIVVASVADRGAAIADIAAIEAQVDAVEGTDGQTHIQKNLVSAVDQLAAAALSNSNR